MTTDHISPAGSIKPNSPAGQYLIAHGVTVGDFNSLRVPPWQSRGDDARDLFANVRLRNKLTPEREGAYTRHLPDAAKRCRFSTASVNYRAAGTPLMVLAGKEYGSGSSRDWGGQRATRLLGVRVALAGKLPGTNSPYSNLVENGRFCRCNSWMTRDAETNGVNG